MSPTGRHLPDILARAAALAGAMEFLAGWLKAADDHQHNPAPPEPPILRDYRPRFCDADFTAL
jgi:hypothetical protein